MVPLLLISLFSALAGGTAASLPPASASIRYNLSEVTLFPHYWKRCFGSGHALLGTRADFREHLRLAVSELGLAGLRFHGTLDDDMSVVAGDGAEGEDDEYYFYNVDLVYDYLVDLGIRPIVELSFMPRALANCTVEGGEDEDCPYAFGSPGSYKGVTAPPRNFTRWSALVRGLASHFVERHGLAEVAAWRFEVWNEMWGVDYPHPYLELYRASAEGVKAAHPALRVGGPATMQAMYVRDFVRRARSLGAPVDFVSTHFYPSDPNCTEAGAAGAGDWDCFAHTVEAAAADAHDAGLPLLLTEYKDGLQGGPGYGHGGAHGDKAYAAAFIIRNIALLADVSNLEVLSWWTFTDIFEEGWLRGVPFSGVYGLMTTQGVRKPAWRAFELLHRAGTERLPVELVDPLCPASPFSSSSSSKNDAPIACTSTLTVLATVGGGGENGADGLQLFLANFGPMEGATGTPWKPTARNVTLTISSLPRPSAGKTMALLTMIDDTSTNPYDTWVAMGSPQYPSPAQVAVLHEASKPKQSVVAVGEEGKLSVALEPYGVAHIAFVH
mmetsp:Transcript_34239/g.63492  ORF Transcript_34239/g.63492 Transcript_34239/m.63492 type:complete len:554 (-) Transcript_34239:108-1769(-)